MSQQTPEHYLRPSDYELEENTPTVPPRVSDVVATPPGTIPERLVAIEKRMLALELTLNKLMPVLNAQAIWARYSKYLVKAAPIWVPIVGAQFPQAKEWLKGLLDTISILQ